MASDFLMCACSSDMCLSGDNLLVKSVYVWNFIVVAVRYCLGQQGGWCQMGVSEASCVDEVRCLCLKLPWFTFDKVRRLFLKLHHVGCDPSNICFWGGSLLMKSDVCFWNFIIGTGITACLSQLFGTWVHWWRRVLVLWRCRKNRKPRLDFSSRCLTSSEAGLWTHQYCWVRQVNWLVWDLLAFWLLR
jgi:hypothetical protein